MKFSLKAFPWFFNYNLLFFAFMINKPDYIIPCFSLPHSKSQSPSLLHPLCIFWEWRLFPFLLNPLDHVLWISFHLCFITEVWPLDQCMAIWAKWTVLLERMTSSFCFISSISPNDKNVSSWLFARLEWNLNFKPKPTHPWWLNFEPSQRAKLSMALPCFLSLV